MKERGAPPLLVKPRRSKRKEEREEDRKGSRK
jgi:hypothetical protein